MNLLNFLKSKTFFKQLGIATIAVVVIIFVLLQWLKRTTNHGEFIEVPDLSKKSVMDVRGILEEKGLRFEVLDSANYNPKYPRFSITEQNPLAGAKVKSNRKIYLKVNPAGYKEVTMPKVIQVTRRNAESMLKAIGLSVSRVSYVDNVGKDMVISVRYKGKKIWPGTRLAKMSKVELICGNGNRSASEIIKTESEN